jgi:hypothetical protein
LGKKSHSGGGVGAYHGDNGGGARSTNIGPSGSAKIEGHVGFGPVLDIKPYLTPQLQQTVFQRAIYHLFAVVVHSGKNSNSGHYVTYVNTNDKWWLLDDARVVRSSWDEVCNAEAYMLFYRVTSHPVAMQVKSIAKKEIEARRVIADQKEIEACRVMNVIRRKDAEVGSLANPPATTTDARKMRSSSRSKSADGDVVTIESSEDDDTSSSTRTMRSSSRPKSADGDVISIDSSDDEGDVTLNDDSEVNTFRLCMRI